MAVSDAAARAGLAFSNHGGYMRTRQRMDAADAAAIEAWGDALGRTTYATGEGAPEAAGAVAVHPHGTREAQRWRQRAHWPGTVFPPQGPALDPALPVAVVLLRRVPNLSRQRELDMTSEAWTLGHQRAVSVLIRTSCLLLDADDASIVGLYVTDRMDPGVAGVAAAGRQLSAQCRKVYPQKRHTNWYGTHRGASGGGYIGHNWLDGAQRFACPTAATKNYVTAFLPRRPHPTIQWHLASTFGGLQALERRHVPDVYLQRLRLAERARFGGIVPGLPLRALAATYTGVTVDFACRPHNDSSMPGTTETICWHRTPGDPEFGFSILEYNVTLLMEGASCLYMLGTLWHGTPPDAPNARTFRHNSLGLVLMSKHAVLADTDATRRANENMQAMAVV